MKPLLCIDTALEEATICLSYDGKLLDEDHNSQPKEHAAWLHPAINNLLEKNNFRFEDLSGIAVSIGPGSYTGLRVGLAAAKGFCYALNIPLISVGTLEIIAHSVKDETPGLICPMIDARRMEVYTAVYDRDLIEKISPLAMILHTNSFESLLALNQVLFCGSGSRKFRELCKHFNARFAEPKRIALSFSILAEAFRHTRKNADIAYCEPLYLKDFHSSTTGQ